MRLNRSIDARGSSSGVKNQESRNNFSSIQSYSAKKPLTQIREYNHDPTGPQHSRNLAKDLTSLDKILGNASTAINKYKPKIHALETNPTLNLAQREERAHSIRQSAHLKPALKLSIPGQSEDIKMFDGGSWQDRTDDINSFEDEGDLTKIIESGPAFNSPLGSGLNSSPSQKQMVRLNSIQH